VDHAAHAAELERVLRRRFRVVDSSVNVAGRTIDILHPASAEDLISEEDFERDERLPYWAELWPSATVLAGRVLALVGAGRTLLELGCGTGLVSTSASLAGFAVTASDYYEDALRFAFVNAWVNGAGAIATQLLDWRVHPVSVGRFDCVAASDVLYEQPYGAHVANTIAATLAPRGTALVADPGRVAADAFVKALEAAGLGVVAQPKFPFVAGEIRQTITVFEIAWS
jgi:predicted nicotinamide N-methyase